jgi:hypothetical protein
VSDVVPKDFSDLLTVLVNAKSFYETPSEEDESRGVTPQPLSTKEAQDLQALFENWSTLYAEGSIVLRPNGFWTEGGSYWRLPKTAPSLYEDLKESELVIFKGDLNYRKLTGDAVWDPTTSFAEALGPMVSANVCISHLHVLISMAGSWIWCPRTRATDMQSRCRCRSSQRRRRATESYGRRRRGHWSEEVGLERQMGRCKLQRWQGMMPTFKTSIALCLTTKADYR